MTTGVGETFNLGPGVLEIGATGTPIDVSCLVNNAVLEADKNQEDSVTKLCGDVVPGSVSYDYHISGNMDIDIADPAGFFALSQNAAGTQQDFTYTPNNDAGTTATGRLIIDPLSFGGDTAGETMTSDFDFAIVSKPSFTYGAPAAAAAGGEEAPETDTAGDTDTEPVSA